VILTSKCCCLSLILKKFQKKSCVSAGANFVGSAVHKARALKKRGRVGTRTVTSRTDMAVLASISFGPALLFVKHHI